MCDMDTESRADATTASAESVRAAETAYVAALDRALFDGNPDLVWELNTDGTVRRTNARIADVLGYPPDAVRGRPVAEFGMPESQDAMGRAFGEALAGRAGIYVCTMRHRDGHAVHMRASLMPLVIGGATVGVFSNMQDVTSAHAADQKLREAEALYRVLVEQLPECVAIFAEGRCKFINPAGAAMRGSGYTPDDVHGHPWTDFVAPEDRASYASLLTELESAPEGTSRAFENHFLWPDGRRVEVDGMAITVRLNGRPAVHLFARDVTVHRRVESERLRAQRLEALGRLAAGVAHDFNNLLAVMLMAVESAAAAVPDDDPLREDLADAADAARRGRALTRQLLTFARRQESRPTTFSLNEVVQNMTDLLRRVAGLNVRLSVVLAPDAGAVTADPGQVEQVLLNLVTNARDALPAGGTVSVETARSDGGLRLTARDTGVGIAPEVRPHLFEPFFTTKSEGYGLGLATVYGVVTGAGGRVDVESAPGQGTAFHLYFPRAIP